MLAGVLVTEGGPHSADKWATITVDQIVRVGPNATPETRSTAEALKAKLRVIVEQLHQAVMDDERTLLDYDGDGRLGSPLDPTEFREDAVAAVVAATKDSPWAAHFEKPEVQDYLGRLLMQHFSSIMDIERSWHADKSTSDVAQAWKTARNRHGGQKASAFLGRYRDQAKAPKKKAATKGA